RHDEPNPKPKPASKTQQVDEDSRGALLGQLNKRMEYGEAMAEETLQKIRDETNEHLKFIVAEHSKWSRLYNEIKYKAQIEDSKTRKQMAKTVVVQIHDIQMKELQFVQTFKPGGHFCDDVLEIFRLIWKESWKPDTIMLSRGAVIFVPFISSDHCSLVVVEPDIRLITVLDSLFDLEESTKRHERLLPQLIHCTHADKRTEKLSFFTRPRIDDCGFHMLLFIMRYKSGNYKNIDEDEILICRQHTAWFLLEHEDNVLRGTFTKGHSKRRLEDKDRGENKKQKNLGDEELRLQLWKKIVLNDEFKSFGAKSCCQDILVSFFIQCLLADEVSHGDDTVGYRIFLDPKISELLLASKDAFNINSVVEELKLQYTDQQILKARHILLPVCHDSHWTVYVINKNFGQIDILDSSWATVEVKRKNHRTIAGVIRSKLSDAILLITDKHPKFSEWSMPIIPASSIAQQKQGSVDCGFFVMMFLKYYNPDTHRLEFCDLKEDFKCKILWNLELYVCDLNF
ncbi:hypothetical protein BDA96_K000900, partial [Sorghum bicolor]